MSELKYELTQAEEFLVSKVRLLVNAFKHDHKTQVHSQTSEHRSYIRCECTNTDRYVSGDIVSELKYELIKERKKASRRLRK